MTQESPKGNDNGTDKIALNPKQPPLPPQLQSLYDKALESMKRENYEYACEMLLNVVYLAPENRQVRRTLRTAQVEVFNKTSRGVQVIILASIKSVADYIQLAIAKARKDTFKTADLCEKILRHYPENKVILGLLSDSLIACNFSESAMDVLEFLRSLDPGDIVVLKKLINLYDECEDVENAIACCEAVLKIAPMENDVHRQYKNLVARRTLKAGNWENTETFRDKIKDADVARKLEQAEQIKSASSEDIVFLYEQQLKDKPDDIGTMRKLADQYMRTNAEKAEHWFGKILELRPDDPYAKRMFASCQTKKISEKVSVLRSELKAKPDDAGLKNELAALEQKQTEIELAEYEGLVAQNPTDMNIKYKYGCLLESVGRIDEAIGMFQKSISSPDLMVNSSIKLAGCFTLNEMFDLALEFYEKALSKMAGYDENDDRKKYIYYQEGRIYEYLSKQDKALAMFRQIYAVDIDYKDVRDHINRLRLEIGED